MAAVSFDAWLASIGAPDLASARAAQGLRATTDAENGELILWGGDDYSQRFRGELGRDMLASTEAAWRSTYAIPVANDWTDSYGWSSGPGASSLASITGANWLGGTRGIVAPGEYPSIYAGATPRAITPQAYQRTAEFNDALAAFNAKHPDSFQLSAPQVKYDTATKALTIVTPGQPGAYILDPTKVTYDPEFGLVAPRDQFGTQGTKGESVWKGGLGSAVQYFLALVSAGTALAAFTAPSSLTGAAAAAASTGTAGAAANQAGLALMAADAGLTGAAAQAFIASGGSMGSTSFIELGSWIADAANVVVTPYVDVGPVTGIPLEPWVPGTPAWPTFPDIPGAPSAPNFPASQVAPGTPIAPPTTPGPTTPASPAADHRPADRSRQAAPKEPRRPRRAPAASCWQASRPRPSI